ncbi:hypothetical protein GCM10027091_28450 [Streptomyces daliensis]
MLPALWVLGVLAWEARVPFETHAVPLLAAAPAVACAGTGHRRGVVAGGACALLALSPLGSALAYEGERESVGGRFGTCAAVLSVVAASYLSARRRGRLAGELTRARTVATAAQEVLLRPVPPRVEGLSVASAYLSATRDASVGGDLYDVVATPYGVRVVMGDVRGHGLPAIGTVSAVLGSFREAVYDEPSLGGVLRRMERGLSRHLCERRAGRGSPGMAPVPGAGSAPVSASALGDPYDGPGYGGAETHGSAGRAPSPAAAEVPDAGEEFMTVLLLEVGRDGSVAFLNCGHPWPYRLSVPEHGPPCAQPVSETEPLPPLGLFPLPARLPRPLLLRLAPGHGLFVHTDGAEDARDADGAYFPLAEALLSALAGRPGPAALVQSVRGSLLRHTGGRLSDDAALLALRNDHCRVPGEPGPAAPTPERELPRPHPSTTRVPCPRVSGLPDEQGPRRGGRGERDGTSRGQPYA